MLDYCQRVWINMTYSRVVAQVLFFFKAIAQPDFLINLIPEFKWMKEYEIWKMVKVKFQKKSKSLKSNWGR